jgi:hypothetical protein
MALSGWTNISTSACHFISRFLITGRRNKYFTCFTYCTDVNGKENLKLVFLHISSVVQAALFGRGHVIVSCHLGLINGR